MARVTSKVMLGSGSIDNFKEYAAEIPLSVIDEMLISEADVVESEVKSTTTQVVLPMRFSGKIRTTANREKARETGKSRLPSTKKGTTSITKAANETARLLL